MQRYTYLRLLQFEHLQNIFTGQEFDPVLLILLVTTFNEQVITN